MTVVERMRANPDRGAVCLECGTTAKDCQVTFVVHNKHCCDECRRHGGARMHREEDR